MLNGKLFFCLHSAGVVNYGTTAITFTYTSHRGRWNYDHFRNYFVRKGKR